MKENIKLLINLLLSLLLIYAVIYFVGSEKVFSVLLGTDLPLFLAAVLSYLAVNLLMSIRIKVILQKMGNNLKLKDIFQSHLAGMMASDFTPARVGYFFTAFSLTSRFRVSLEKTIMSIFGPQLLDFLVKVFSALLLVFFMAGALGLGEDSIILNLVFLLVFLAAVIFTGLLLFYPPFLQKFSFLNSLPLIPKLISFLQLMHNHAKSVLDVKLEIILIGIASWIIKGLEWLLLAWALGIFVGGDWVSSLFFMMVFQAAITILQFLPLPTVAGAGASEAGFAAILYVFGVTPEAAVSFGLLTRLIMIIVDSFSLPVIMAYIKTHTIDETFRKVEEVGKH